MDKSAYYGWGLPIDISTHGAHIDQLIDIVHVFMALLFVGWGLFMAYSLYRFRARPGHAATYKLPHFRAPTYLEAGVALFEVVLLAGFSYPVMHRLKENFPRPESARREIRVVAEQFAWNIHYPGVDEVFGKTDSQLVDDTTNPLGRVPDDAMGQDDVTTINQLHIPVDTPILIYLSSKDVIHSLSLPVARVKQDAIPGEVIPLWFEANRTGDFEIACAQLCGENHYRMRGDFKVQSQKDFEVWLSEKKKSMGSLTAPTGGDTQEEFEEEFE